MLASPHNGLLYLGGVFIQGLDCYSRIYSISDGVVPAQYKKRQAQF